MLADVDLQARTRDFADWTNCTIKLYQLESKEYCKRHDETLKTQGKYVIFPLGHEIE